MGSKTNPNPHWRRSTGTQRRGWAAAAVSYLHVSVPFFARKDPMTGAYEVPARHVGQGRAFTFDNAKVGVTFKRRQPKVGRNEPCGCRMGFDHKSKDHWLVATGTVPRMERAA